MGELAVIEAMSPAEIYRMSTDAAGLSREIVTKTAMVIGDRKYVKVEGWQAIAIAHGCAASSGDVYVTDLGVSAMGEVRRMSDGALIAKAEGFVGADEPTWYGGTVEKDEWEGPKGSRRKTGCKITTTLPPRPLYAIRAMAQTRAISRACRSAFAHVVVLIDENLSTTPAEEVPEGGFGDMHNVSPGTPGNPGPATSGGGDPQIRTNPEDRQEQPNPIQLRVTAMMTAHTVANNVGELNKWLRENKEELDKWPDDSVEYQTVVKSFNARRSALMPPKQDKPADKPSEPQGGAPAEADNAAFRGGADSGVSGSNGDGDQQGRPAAGAAQQDQRASDTLNGFNTADLDDEIPF